MKTLSLFDAIARTGRDRHKNRICEQPGCLQSTREGKPYCPDHVEMHPYVQTILARIAERDEQDEKVAAKGSRAVVLESVTVQEVLQHLAFHGARTEERLVLELNLDTKTLSGYLGALSHRGYVSFGKTKRGSTLVKLRRTLEVDVTVSPAQLEQRASA